MIGAYAVRVVRQWPGGPPKGRVMDSLPAARREQLLRLRMVEEVTEGVTDDASAKPKRKVKRRAAALNG